MLAITQKAKKWTAKTLLLAFAALLMGSFLLLAAGQTALAAETPGETTTGDTKGDNPSCPTDQAARATQGNCSNYQGNLDEEGKNKNADPLAEEGAKCKKDNCDLILKYVNPTIIVATTAFGIIVVGSLIYGGIQYSSSGGDSQKVTAAKRRITMTIVALVSYALLLSFLNFLIPGGVG